MAKPIIIAGYSGHGLVVADTALAARKTIVGYTEKEESSVNPFDLTFLGFEKSDALDSLLEKADFIIGVGNNQARRKIADFLTHKGAVFQSVLHPQSAISQTASIGFGTLIGPNVSVNAMARVGHHVILNTGCIVEHNCEVGDFVHIAPGAILTGNVRIGETTMIGANATVLPGVKIGNNVVIGAGSVVRKDIPSEQIWAGNPLKRIK